MILDYYTAVASCYGSAYKLDCVFDAITLGMASTRYLENALLAMSHEGYGYNEHDRRPYRAEIRRRFDLGETTPARFEGC